MARSREALIKRAQKRAVPLEVQKQNDLKPSRIKAQSKVVSKGVLSTKREVSEREKGGSLIKPISISEWMCSKCNNKNFASRSNCNRCMEPNLTAPSSPLSTLIPKASIPVEIKKINDAHINALSSSARNWPTQADEVTIKNNERLRELLKSEIETGILNTDLTTEERERAQQLMERSKRKKSKKEQHQKSKIFRKKAAAQKLSTI